MIETGARRREIEEVASELFHANGYAGDERPRHRPGARHPGRQPVRPRGVEGGRPLVDRRPRRDRVRAGRRPAPSAETPTGDAVERLAALVEAHVEVVTADPERSSVFVTEWRHLSADRRAAIAARRDAYEAPLPRRHRRRASRSAPSGRPTRPIAATFILSALNGIATWYRPDGRLSPDRIADHYVDLALRSLSEDHR